MRDGSTEYSCASIYEAKGTQHAQSQIYGSNVVPSPATAWPMDSILHEPASYGIWGRATTCAFTTIWSAYSITMWLATIITPKRPSDLLYLSRVLACGLPVTPIEAPVCTCPELRRGSNIVDVGSGSGLQQLRPKPALWSKRYPHEHLSTLCRNSEGVNEDRSERGQTVDNRNHPICADVGRSISSCRLPDF